jgi:uncharacterized membrane protein YhhN
MRPALFLIFPLAITVFFLIRAEFRKDQRQIQMFKPISTSLLIIVAVLSFWESRINLTYSIGVLVGLALCFGGDMALMFQSNRKAFMLGLVLFLLAHLAYGITFTLLDNLHNLDWLSALVLLAIGAGIYRLFQPGLGSMKVPVIAYVIIISVMVNQALSAFTGSDFSTGQAWMVSTGAILFYISDIILAANRYWKPFKYQRISLAFYYSGQFLVALAASYF